MSYQKVNWQDRMVSKPHTYTITQQPEGTSMILPVFDEQTDFSGTPVNAANLGHMDDGIEAAHQLIEDFNRKLARIDAYLDIEGRGVSGAQARFADTYDGQPDPVLQLDTTKTYATAALAASASTVVVPVASTAGFAVGQEVTICDDVASEDQLIKAIGAGTISVAKLAGSYKKGAMVARSTVERDTVNKKMRIGGWGTYTVTITQV